MNTQVY